MIKPHKTKIAFINSMISESLILLINAIMVKCTIPGTSESEIENLGVGITFLMSLTLSANYIMWIIDIIKAIMGILRENKHIVQSSCADIEKTNEEKKETNEIKNGISINENSATNMVLEESKIDENKNSVYVEELDDAKNKKDTFILPVEKNLPDHIISSNTENNK